MTTNQDAVAPEPPRCGNCRTPLAGGHCHVCGQPVRGLIRPLAGWIADFLDSVFNWDGRLPRTLLPLLLRPGFLTAEYIAGRRVRYVTPVRLFLFLAIILFFAVRLVADVGGALAGGSAGLSPFPEDAERIARLVDWLPPDQRAEVLKDAMDPQAPAAVDTAAAIDRTAGDDASAEVRAAAGAGSGADTDVDADRDDAGAGLQVQTDGAGRGDVIVLGGLDGERNKVQLGWLSDGMNAQLNLALAKIASSARRINEDPRQFVEQLLSVAPQTLFFMLPVFALLLKLAYLFRRRLYMEHLLVALHSHSFIAITLLLMIGLSALGGLAPGLPWFGTAMSWLVIALACWIPVNLFLTQKRVYGQGWLMTFVKFSVIGLLYIFLLTAAMVLAILLSLLLW
jgi:hypothetical protein